MRVQQWLDLVLSGNMPLSEAPRAIQSYARFFVYEGAVEILSLDREDRRAALDKLPALIRPLVEAEAVRVWDWRRGNRG